MKLHLPKVLRAAVLACIAVAGGLAKTLGTGAVVGGLATALVSPAMGLTLSEAEYTSTDGASITLNAAVSDYVTTVVTFDVTKLSTAMTNTSGTAPGDVITLDGANHNIGLAIQYDGATTRLTGTWNGGGNYDVGMNNVAFADAAFWTNAVSAAATLAYNYDGSDTGTLATFAITYSDGTIVTYGGTLNGTLKGENMNIANIAFNTELVDNTYVFHSKANSEMASSLSFEAVTLLTPELTFSGANLTWVTNAEFDNGKLFKPGDKVVFNGSETTVTLGENINAAAVTINEGSTVELDGDGHTFRAYDLLINGSLTLTNLTLAAETKIHSESSGTLILDAPEISLTSSYAGLLVDVRQGSLKGNSYRGITVTDGGAWTLSGNVANTPISLSGHGLAGSDTDGALNLIDANYDIQNTCSLCISGDTSIYVANGKILKIRPQTDADSTLHKKGTGALYFMGNMSIAEKLSVDEGSVVIGWGASPAVEIPEIEVASGADLYLWGGGNVTWNIGAITMNGGSLKAATGGSAAASSTTSINGKLHLLQNSSLTYTGDSKSIGVSFDELTGSGNLAIAQNGATTNTTTFLSIKDYSGTISKTPGTNGTLDIVIGSVDQANGKTATITGDVVARNFIKQGAGGLAVSGAARFEGALTMNYEGSLTFDSSSVADNTRLIYGENGTLLTFAYTEGLHYMVDLTNVAPNELTQGVNLGLSGFSTTLTADEQQTLLTHLGLPGGKLSVLDGILWYTATSDIMGETVEVTWEDLGSEDAARKDDDGQTVAVVGEFTTDTSLSGKLGYNYNGNISAKLVGGGGASVQVAGGIIYTEGSAAAANEQSNGVWIDVAEGTYLAIVGGNINATSNGSGDFTGDTHIQVSESAQPTHVIGGNLLSASNTTFTGNSYISVAGNVAGCIVGATVLGDGDTATFRGNTYVNVHAPQTIGANTGYGNAHYNPAISGASSHLAASSAPALTSVFEGDTHVNIDLSGYRHTGDTPASFEKILLGGFYNSWGNNNADRFVGSTHVEIRGHEDVIFNKMITGGSYVTGLSFSHTGGSTNVTIHSGTFTKRVQGGSNLMQCNGLSLADSKLVIKGGTFEGTVLGGHYLRDVSGATCGDSAISFENATAKGDIVGGIYLITSNNTVSQGAVSLDLNSGTIGNVYAAGYQQAVNTGITTESVAVTLGKQLVINSGSTISGGYYFADGVTKVSTVTNGSTLNVNGSALSGVTLRDFNTVNVASMESHAALTLSNIETLALAQGADLSLWDGKSATGGVIQQENLQTRNTPTGTALTLGGKLGNLDALIPTTEAGTVLMSGISTLNGVSIPEGKVELGSVFSTLNGKAIADLPASYYLKYKDGTISLHGADIGKDSFYWESSTPNAKWSSQSWATVDGGTDLIKAPNVPHEPAVHVVFNNGKAETVVVDTAVKVDDMTISGTNSSYTFTNDGGSLTVAGTLKVNNKATADFSTLGVTLDGGTLTMDNTATLAAGTVSGTGSVLISGGTLGNSSFEGKAATATTPGLSVSVGGSTIAEGATLSLTNATLTGSLTTAAAHSSVLLNGVIGIDGSSFAAADVNDFSVYYNGAVLANSGFRQEQVELRLHNGKGTFSAAPGTSFYSVQDANAAIVYKAASSTVSIVSTVGTVYYINGSDTIDYDSGAAFTNAENKKVTGFVLNGGSLELSTTPSDLAITAAQNGSIAIQNGIILHRNQRTDTGNAVISLTGSGTYDLANATVLGTNQSGSNVALADTWRGTISTTAFSYLGAEGNVSALGNAHSKVLLTAAPGVSGLSASGMTAGTVGTVVVNDRIALAGNNVLNNAEFKGMVSLAAGATLKANNALTLSNDGIAFADLANKVTAQSLTNTTLNLYISDDELGSLRVGRYENLLLELTESSSATLTLNGGTFYTAKNIITPCWNATGTSLVLDVAVNREYVADAVGATTKNGVAGASLLSDALGYLNPQVTDPDGDVAALLNAVDAGEMTDDDAAAIAGASVATLGMALSGDVERQLKAIRNRTTTMGVNECVVNEGMPYFNAWVNAEGNRAELDKDGTAAGYVLDSWGGTVGFDVDCNDNLTVGLAITAMYGDIDSDGVDRLTGDMDTTYVSLFARYATCGWTHTFVGTVGMMDGSYERTVNAAGVGYETEGDVEGMSFGLMYEVGYVIPLTDDATACLQPVFNVMLRHSVVDSYTEDGSDAALDVGEQTMTSLTFGLGTRVQTVVGESIYNRASLLEARVLAKAELGDRSSEADVTMLGGNNGTSVESAELGVFGIEVGAGLSIPLGDDDGSIFIDGSYEFRSGYSNVNGTVGYRVNF